MCLLEVLRRPYGGRCEYKNAGEDVGDFGGGAHNGGSSSSSCAWMELSRFHQIFQVPNMEESENLYKLYGCKAYVREFPPTPKIAGKKQFRKPEPF